MFKIECREILPTKVLCVCSSQCDQVMEFSWSALWNITDETPDNCQMFLNCRGMSLFLECLQVSPQSQLCAYLNYIHIHNLYSGIVAI